MTRRIGDMKAACLHISVYNGGGDINDVAWRSGEYHILTCRLPDRPALLWRLSGRLPTP